MLKMEVKEESLDSDLKDILAMKQEPIFIQKTDGFEISGYSYLPNIKQEICNGSEALANSNNSEKYSLEVEDKNSRVNKLVRHEHSDLNDSIAELNVHCDLPDLKTEKFYCWDNKLLNIKHDEDSDLNLILKTESIAEQCDLRALKTEDFDVSDPYFNSTKSQKPLRNFKRKKFWKVPKKNNCLCPICSKGCFSSQSRTKHVASHFAKDFVICGFCGQFFTNELQFLLHHFNHFIKRKKNTGKIFLSSIVGHDKDIQKLFVKIMKHPQNYTIKSFKCKVCFKLFTNSSDLNRHYKVHPGDEAFKCKICLKRFSCKPNLKRHLRIHTGEKPFKCKVCSKQFNCSSNLRKHLRRHHLIPFKCELCSKVFSENSSLKEHFKRMHAGVKPFKCDICSSQFSHKSSLKSHHLRDHTSQCKVTQFSCEICSNSRKKSLTGHSRIHRSEKPFKCEICLKRFSCKTNLSRHLRIHAGKKPLHCELCSKAFSKKSSLKEHFKTRHKRVNLFKCEVCSEQFGYKSTLKRHLLRSHASQSEDKRFVCEICSKCFALKYDLDTHSRIHIEKPFKCVICSKCFLLEVDLTSHSRIHTGKNRFYCEICSKGFTQNSSLKDHYIIHTGDKPFACEICARQFGRKSSLKRHLIIHNQIRLRPTPLS